MTEREWRLYSLEDVRDVGLERREAAFVQFDASWTGFLHVSQHLADSRNKIFGLDEADRLEDVSAMTHLEMSVLYNAFGKNGGFTDQWNSNPGSETTI